VLENALGLAPIPPVEIRQIPIPAGGKQVSDERYLMAGLSESAALGPVVAGRGPAANVQGRQRLTERVSACTNPACSMSWR
jgi:hypothetical protein